MREGKKTRWRKFEEDRVKKKNRRGYRDDFGGTRE